MVIAVLPIWALIAIGIGIGMLVSLIIGWIAGLFKGKPRDERTVKISASFIDLPPSPHTISGNESFKYKVIGTIVEEPSLGPQNLSNVPVKVSSGAPLMMSPQNGEVKTDVNGVATIDVSPIIDGSSTIRAVATVGPETFPAETPPFEVTR